MQTRLQCPHQAGKGPALKPSLEPLGSPEIALPALLGAAEGEGMAPLPHVVLANAGQAFQHDFSPLNDTAIG